MIKSKRPSVFSNFSSKVKSISIPFAQNESSRKRKTPHYQGENDEEQYPQFTQHTNNFDLNNDACQDEDFYDLNANCVGSSHGDHTMRFGTQQSYMHDSDRNGYTQQPTLTRHSMGYVQHQKRPQISDRGPSSMQRNLQMFQAPPPSHRNCTTMEDEQAEEDFEMEEQYEEQPSPSPAATKTSKTSQILLRRQTAATQAVAKTPVQFSAPRAFETFQHNFAVNEEGDSLAPLAVSTLPTHFQSLFSFTHFNKAQTIAFQDLYSSDKNVVVTAPTGAGKTVMFELAFMRMLNINKEAKAVYLAPTKALCSERHNDWSERLGRIGCKVLLMTSDTETKLSAAATSSLIVATPEKWDHLTRTKTFARSKTLLLVRLLLIDEVHILREMKRGAVMEVLVSRMKALSDDIRFVAVSATIPNAEDVSTWIGRRDNEAQIISGPGVGEIDGSAQLYNFSEHFRPCPLIKYVDGYRNPGKDQWSFERELNNKLMDTLEAHLEDKAALIFCPTRKTSIAAAQALATQYRQLIDSDTKAPWTLVRGRPESIDFEDAQLQELYTCGIGYHHAGLCMEDRRAIEFCFMQGHLKILCCTSSLAVGINLPAFLVIIRGTALYDGSAWVDYKDLDVLQMMGRAGRPQFDTEGVCVIMTEQQHKGKWNDLVRGETVVESTLHLNLVEHVNAEIYIRYGASVAEMQAWLCKTFFFVRLCKMPQHYRLPGCEDVDDATEAIGITIRRIMKELAEHGLIDDFEEDNDRKAVICSVYGAIMAKTGISFETMKTLRQVEENASLRSLIETISHAKEYDGIMLRSGEKDLYNTISKDALPFPPDQINDIHDKISLILQASLAGIDLDTLLKKQGQQLAINPRSDVSIVLEHAPTVVRALLQIVVEKKYASTTKNALQLLRCVNGSAWEGTAAELRQVYGIGSVIMSTLATAGIDSIAALRVAKVERLSMLLNKSSDAVKKMINDAKRFPRFQVSVEETPKRAIAGLGVETTIKVIVDLQLNIKERKSLLTKCNAKTPWRWCVLIRSSNPENHVCVLSGGKMKDLIEGALPMEETILLTDPNEEILVLVACLEAAGSVVECRTRSSWPAKKFPKITRVNDPSDSVDSDLDHLPTVKAKVPAKQVEKKEEPAKVKKSMVLSSSSKTASAVLREIQAIEAETVKFDSLDSDSEGGEEENQPIAKKKAVSKPAKKTTSPIKKQESKPRVKKSYEEKKREKEKLEQSKADMLAKIARTIGKKEEKKEESKKKKKIESEVTSKAAKKAPIGKTRSIDDDLIEDSASVDAIMLAAADAMEQSETEQGDSDPGDMIVWRKKGEDSEEDDDLEAARNRKKYRSVDWNFNVAEASKLTAEQEADRLKPKPKPKKVKKSSASEVSTMNGEKSKASLAKERLYVTIDDSESEDQGQVGDCIPPAKNNEPNIEDEEQTGDIDENGPCDQAASYDYFDQYIDYEDDIMPQEEADSDERYRRGSEDDPMAMQDDSYAMTQVDVSNIDTMDMEMLSSGYPSSSQLPSEKKKSIRRIEQDSEGLHIPDIDIKSQSMSGSEEHLEQLLFEYD